MGIIRKEQEETEYIVVHKLKGPAKVIRFIHNISHIRAERLFFDAKRDGQTTFFYNDKKYFLRRMRDGSFLIVEDERDYSALRKLGQEKPAGRSRRARYLGDGQCAFGTWSSCWAVRFRKTTLSVPLKYSARQPGRSLFGRVSFSRSTGWRKSTMTAVSLTMQ